VSKQVTAGNRKPITQMICQELEIIRRLERGEGRRRVMASYNIGLLNVSNIQIWKVQVWSCMASRENLRVSSS